AVIQSLTSTTEIYWTRTPRHGGAIFGPYVDHDHYAGLMEMLFPLPIVLSLSVLTRGPKRVLVAFAGVIMAGSIILSQSRAGTLSFLVEMALLLKLLGSEMKPRTAAAIGTVCFVAAAFAAWVGPHASWHHFASLQDGMRLAIIQDSLLMFL